MFHMQVAAPKPVTKYPVPPVTAPIATDPPHMIAVPPFWMSFFVSFVFGPLSEHTSKPLGYGR